MSEEELLHLIGKLAYYVNDHTIIDKFTKEEISILFDRKKEYEFWERITSQQSNVKYLSGVKNPCSEISL